MGEVGKRRRRRWPLVLLLGIGFAVFVIATWKQEPSARSLTFLQGAKHVRSESGVVVLNRYTAGGPPSRVHVQRQLDTFEIPRSFEDVSKMAEREVMSRTTSLLASNEGTGPKTRFLSYQDDTRKGTVSILIAAGPNTSRSTVTVTEYPPPSWLDKTVMWFKGLFHR